MERVQAGNISELRTTQNFCYNHVHLIYLKNIRKLISLSELSKNHRFTDLLVDFLKISCVHHSIYFLF